MRRRAGGAPYGLQHGPVSGVYGGGGTITAEPHLIEDGKPTLERAHPLCGCGACESLAPLARHGAVVRCDHCQTEHVPGGGHYQPRRRSSSALAGEGPAPERLPQGRDQQLPEPPSAGELKLVERIAQSTNTFQQSAFRSFWSSRTRSRISSGSCSHCHWRSARAAASPWPNADQLGRN
jgi:hypothetical protein